jgi:membrane-associated phospholipid phosphatase
VPQRNWRQALRPVPRPLLPAAVRPVAAVVLASCVAVTAFLGAWFAHQQQAGSLDQAVDARIRASLESHYAVLNQVVQLGDPRSVTILTVALLAVCAAARRWRGMVLVAVAVPTAAAITEFALKPFIDRTLSGDLSFPSGHTTGISALAAAIAVLLLRSPRLRVPAVLRVLLALAGYAVAAAVATGLVGLGMHYFTDTIGGAAVGTATVLATAFVIDRLAPHEHRQPIPVTSASAARSSPDTHRPALATNLPRQPDPWQRGMNPRVR